MTGTGSLEIDSGNERVFLLNRAYFNDFLLLLLFPGGGGSRMGTGSRKSSHHQRSGSNPINPSSSNSIPSHASAVSATSEDYVDMSPAGSASGSRPGAVPIPNRNMSSTSLTFGTSPSAGMYLFKYFLS